MHFDKDGNPIDLAINHTRELVILSYDTKDLGAQIQQIFCAPGDSGSFVIETDGAVAGILHGYFAGFCGGQYHCGAGLVAYMAEILPFIAKRTTVADGKG